MAQPPGLCLGRGQGLLQGRDLVLQQQVALPQLGSLSRRHRALHRLDLLTQTTVGFPVALKLLTEVRLNNCGLMPHSIELGQQIIPLSLHAVRPLCLCPGLSQLPGLLLQLLPHAIDLGLQGLSLCLHVVCPLCLCLCLSQLPSQCVHLLLHSVQLRLQCSPIPLRLCLSLLPLPLGLHLPPLCAPHCLLHLRPLCRLCLQPGLQLGHVLPQGLPLGLQLHTGCTACFKLTLQAGHPLCLLGQPLLHLGQLHGKRLSVGAGRPLHTAVCHRAAVGCTVHVPVMEGEGVVARGGGSPVGGCL
eukprot:comp21341_c0_seq1/m.29266 comp21341_c0_seq1/g.29266  ORF comp21341_c0_seq1/g.29266 comp21341_c0_seq1/m.29266 type:complete len:301 (+) comp21341_c0_seq1:1269-2171(+)